MQAHTYLIDPIRAESGLGPELAKMLEGTPGWSADDWKDIPGNIAGWQLTLMRDQLATAVQQFEGTEDGFDQAQEAGKQWLADNGEDASSQWIAGGIAAMRRTNCDPDFRHRISKRGF